MNYKKWIHIALAASLLSGVFAPNSFVYAASDVSSVEIEVVTLAEMPSLVITGVSGNTHHLKIITTNPPNTDMLIEKSSTPDFSQSEVFLDWTPITNGHELSVFVGDGESGYLRIKARNQEGIETEFSAPIVLNQAPTMPTLARQVTGTHSIALQLNDVMGATDYKIKRTDLGTDSVFTGKDYTDSSVLPGRPYTYEFWAERSGQQSEKNTISLWTKPEAPALFIYNTSSSSVQLEVDLKDNPQNSEIEVQRDNGNPKIQGLKITETNLMPSRSYEYRVRVKSANNEFSPWVTQTVTTGESASSLPSSGGGAYYPPTQVNLSDVQISYDENGNLRIIGIDEKAEYKYYAIITDSNGKQIKSPLFNTLKELEEWLQKNLIPGQKYKITIGIEVDKNKRHEKTIDYTVPLDPNKANSLLKNIKIITDGEPNTRISWVEFDLTSIPTTVQVVLNGQTKQAKGTVLRFENLDDNRTYTAELKLYDSSSDKAISQKVEVKTPNRTAPEILNATYNQGEIVLNVVSVSELEGRIE
ncbi:hypothetical protein P9265_14860 [Schinkia azotoformans]|uniref:hypothetical protein n=1 Tax=Schinkia azotoformans TaxID=1454 RepID=UPI002E200BA9|nr:hypothetical protein [Schinkia azotoformans]